MFSSRVICKMVRFKQYLTPMEASYCLSRIPPSEKAAFADFLASYPFYRDTAVIDTVRREEYPHLDDKGNVSLDYTGVGLFSSLQKILRSSSSAIGFSYTSVNLATHALYTEEGTTDSFFRKRILRHLNLDERDYYIVFTANSFSAFKLLGESFPFHEAQNLLLGYDHQCENLEGMLECAHAKAASVISPNLSWQRLKVDAEDLRKKLQEKRKRADQKLCNSKGLFAYPVMSRVTGSKNSLQWISEAQQNGWHVLLDVTSVAAKTLDSLGLSVFLPDFIICSFYKVFGHDPTGFGCLVIKKSVLRTLGDSSRARAIGMVKIVTKQPTSMSPTDSPGSVSLANGSSTSYTTDDSPHSSPQPGHSSENVAWDNFMSHRLECDSDVPFKANEDRPPVTKGGMNKWNDLDATCSSWQQGSACSSTPTPDVNLKPSQCNYSMSTVYEGRNMGTRSIPKLSTSGGDDIDIISGIKALRTTSYFEGYKGNLSDDVIVPVSTARCLPDWTGVLNQGDSSTSGSTREQDPQVGSWGFYSRTPIRSSSDGRTPYLRIDAQVSRKKSVKGLFYGECIALQTPDHAVSTAAETLKGKLPQRTSMPSPVKGTPLVSDLGYLYAKNEKSSGSVSHKLISHVSAPCSPSRIGLTGVGEEIAGPAAVSNGGNHSEAMNKETEVICKGLNHAETIGCKRIAIRVRSLTNWLISSLLRLRHPQPGKAQLVKIYSQMSPADCGSTVTFNLVDSVGNLFDPGKVQKLADRSNISLRTGCIEGLQLVDQTERYEGFRDEFMTGCVELAGSKWCSKGEMLQTIQLPVVYATLGFLNNFSDVYRLWVFVSQFLDPKFVEQELWHYQALNQETIEV